MQKSSSAFIRSAVKKLWK